MTITSPTSARFSIGDRMNRSVLNAQTALAAKVDRELGGNSRFKWVWVVLIGVLVIAAAAAWVKCRADGYDGFNGNIEAVKGPMGVKIGIKIGCY